VVFLDANLFIIDRFFRRNVAYRANRRFLDRLGEIRAAVPVLTLLQLCGAASFRLSGDEAERWLHDFPAVYPVEIVDPFAIGEGSAQSWLGALADDLSRYISRRMTFGDAILAREADRHGAEAIVTWNVKDFAGRVAVPVRSPENFASPTRS
jgi:predicted nucleic acid-binding protein